MWENIDIKLVTIEARRNYLVSEPNNHTSKYFSENVLAIEMKKTKQNNKNKKKKTSIHKWTNLFSSIAVEND